MLASHDAQARVGAVQTAGNVTLVGPRRCKACGAYLRGRQRVACSDRCRATRWRRQGEAAQRAEAESIRLAVTLLRAGVDDLAARLDRARGLGKVAPLPSGKPSA